MKKQYQTILLVKESDNKMNYFLYIYKLKKEILAVFLLVFTSVDFISADTGDHRNLLLEGKWLLLSIHDPDINKTTNFDTKLSNGLLFYEKNKVSEVIQRNKSENPYKMTYTYTIDGECLMVKSQNNETNCWKIIFLDNKSLKLLTPIGEYTLEKQSIIQK